MLETPLLPQGSMGPYIVCTWAPKYLPRDDMKAKVYTCILYMSFELGANVYSCILYELFNS